MKISASFIVIVFFLISLFGLGCKNNSTEPDPEPYTTDLTGEYLGQQPPGTTPVRFAPTLLLASDTRWWHDAPAFSPNGQELYMSFYDTEQEPKVSIDFMRVENDFWTFPQTASFSGEYRDNGPRFSINGDKLYFTSRRSGGAVFVVNRIDDDWSATKTVNIPRTTSSDFIGISVTRDGAIYFGDVNSGHLDIYQSRLVDGQYETPENLGLTINTDSEEWGPYIDPDEDFIIFTSNRPGGFGLHDLYISFQNESGSWSEPQNMGSTINSSSDDSSPLISPDGKYLFYLAKKEGDQSLSPFWVDAQIIENFRPETVKKEIFFQSDHFKLIGDLQIPAGAGKRPAIIMVHGDGGIDRYDSGKYCPIMNRFLRAGYAVLSWDKPGTGKSTGRFENGAWIITDRASILVDAVEFLKNHPAIDPERIGVWGISQAGAVMPMALTKTDDIAFMIVVSGPGVDSIDQTAYLIGQKLLCESYSEVEAELAEQSYAGICKATTYQEYYENKTNLIQFPSALIFTGADILPEEEWHSWNRSVDAFFNPIEVIEQTTIPVLAIFGEKDRQVDPIQGAHAYEKALQKAGNQNFHIELIPYVDHNIVLCETGCLAERDNRSMADWLKYAPEYLDLMEEWLIHQK